MKDLITQVHDRTRTWLNETALVEPTQPSGGKQTIVPQLDPIVNRLPMRLLWLGSDIRNLVDKMVKSNRFVYDRLDETST
jgi:hypothetical protein